jgi:hypothetical protein
MYDCGVHKSLEKRLNCTRLAMRAAKRSAVGAQNDRIVKYVD